MAGIGAGYWRVEDRVEELKRLLGAGLSATQIARALTAKFRAPITRNAIIGKVARLGLKLPNSSSKRKRPKAAERRSPLKGIVPPKPKTALRRALEMAPEPMPDTEPEIVVPIDERVGIEGLTEHQCRWGIGDPQHSDFHFCHQKKVGGTSYCERHLRRAYQPLPPPKPRHSIVNASNPMPVRVKEDA